MERTTKGGATARAFGSATATPAADPGAATATLPAHGGSGDPANMVTHDRVGLPAADTGTTLLFTARAFGSAVVGSWRVDGWRAFGARAFGRGGADGGYWTHAAGGAPGVSRRVGGSSE